MTILMTEHTLFDAMKDCGLVTGTLVKSRCGHDAGHVYLVASEMESFCFLVDGDKKPLSRPKKKRRKHLRALCRMDCPVQWFFALRTLPEDQQNAKIRKEIERLIDSHRIGDTKEGE